MMLQNDGFLIFSQLMRHPLNRAFHLSNLLQMPMTIAGLMLSSSATSHVVVKASALIITFSWSLSTSDGCPLLRIFRALVSFVKLLEQPLHHTFVNSFWAKCIVDVVSCLCCFMTHFEIKFKNCSKKEKGSSPTWNTA